MSFNIDLTPGKRAYADAEHSATRPRLESNAMDILPVEIWSTIASYVGKNDLKNLSQVSHFDQMIALRALNVSEMNNLLSALKVLSTFNPQAPEKIDSDLDFYQDVLHEIHRQQVLQILPEQQNQLQQRLTALATDAAAKDLLSLSHTIYQDIDANIAFFKDIEQKYLSKKIAYIQQAFIEIAAASTNHKHVRGFFVEAAADKNHGEIVRSLLKSGPISRRYRGMSVQNATNRGNLEIVNQLLANGEISDNRRCFSVQEAAKQGNEQILASLLASGPVSSLCRGLSLTCAAMHGHLEIIKALLANGDINSDQIGNAITLAADRGYLEIVQVLVEQGDISLEQINFVFLAAVNQNRIEIVRFLLDHAAISTAIIEEAIAISAIKGYTAIVQLFLDRQCVSEEAKSLALFSAAYYNHQDIVDLFTEQESRV